MKPQLITAQQAAAAVQAAWLALAKTGKPQAHEHTVLAGIAVTLDAPGAELQGAAATCSSSGEHGSDAQQEQPQQHGPWVVALGTGTKCLGGSKRRAGGEVVNDCHAEALARRSLLAWLYGEARLALAQYAGEGATSLGNEAGQPNAGDAAEQHAAPAAAAATTYTAVSELAGQSAGAPTGTSQPLVGITSTGIAPPAAAPTLLATATMSSTPAPQPQPSQQLQRVKSKPQPALIYDPRQCKFLVRPGLSLHMYISQPPCGDGSVVEVAQKGQAEPATLRQHTCSTCSAEEGQGGARTSGHNAAGGAVLVSDAGGGCVRFRTGAKAIKLLATSDVPQNLQAGTSTAASHVAGEDHSVQEGTAVSSHQSQQVHVPQAHEVEAGLQELGAVRRKPGKGDATLSLSCSDKLARWACLGVQGSLLSGLLAVPLYFSTLTVSMLPEVDAAGEAAATAAQHAVERAVGGRLVAHDVQAALAPPFVLTPPTVYTAAVPPPSLALAPSEARKVPSGASVNWTAPAGCCTPGAQQPKPGAGTHEALQGADGYKAGASKAQLLAGRARSRLCKAALMSQALDLLRQLGELGGGGQGLAGGAETAKVQGRGELQGVSSVQFSRVNTTPTYRTLKAQLAPLYAEAWGALRARPPFNLWIGKDPALEEFKAGTTGKQTL